MDARNLNFEKRTENLNGSKREGSFIFREEFHGSILLGVSRFFGVLFFCSFLIGSSEAAPPANFRSRK